MPRRKTFTPAFSPMLTREAVADRLEAMITQAVVEAWEAEPDQAYPRHGYLWGLLSVLLANLIQDLRGDYSPLDFAAWSLLPELASDMVDSTILR